MKTTIRLTELRARTQHDLQEQLKAKRQELFNLRFQMATGKLENHREIRQVRRDLARILGLMHERRLRGEENGQTAAAAAPPQPPARRRLVPRLPVRTRRRAPRAGKEKP